MKLVLIEWVDSHSIPGGWKPLDDAAENLAAPLHIRSVGWLVSESGGAKVVAPHISGEKNGDCELCVRGEISIPDRAVVKMTVLRKGAA